jgi:hypothetical protein
MARGEAKGRADDGSMKGVLSGRGVYRVASLGRGGAGGEVISENLVGRRHARGMRK